MDIIRTTQIANPLQSLQSYTTGHAIANFVCQFERVKKNRLLYVFLLVLYFYVDCVSVRASSCFDLYFIFIVLFFFGELS